MGMKHATEVDHLAAVATLAAGKQSLAQTLHQGVAWGVGHTLSLMLFGSLVMLLGTAIPPWLEHGLEMMVGVMLILLGADLVRRLIKQKIHFHVHGHDDSNGQFLQHVHAHSHAVSPANGEAHTHAPAKRRGLMRRFETHSLVAHSAQDAHHHVHPKKLPLRALLVGMMHGMAGTAAMILLSLTAVKSISLGLLYILIFGLGSVVGMAVLSTVIAIPLRLSVVRLAWLHHGITLAFGSFSCLLGAWMVYQIGFVGT